jgi:hypothetical protein
LLGRGVLYRAVVARTRLAVSLLGVALAGCPKDPPPESVRLELPSVVLERTPVRPVVKGRRQRESKTIAEGGYTLRVEPPALAAVNADGTFTCAKSGDGKITAEVVNVRDTKALRCRLADRIEVKELTTLDLKQGGVALETRVVDKAGHELSDVPVSVSSSNREIVTVQELQVTPVAVGAATLVVRAGGAQKKLDVRVVRSIDFQAQPLRGGRRIDITLPKGNHEIEVVLKEPKELRIDWRGARQCNYRATATTHRSTCVLEDKGGAVVDNPAFVESGETAIDPKRVIVRQIP